MALGTTHNTVTTAANFIPELWLNEVIAAYKSNVVMRDLVTVINHVGRKGDTLHIPNFTRSLASTKAAETAVTLVAPTHGVTNVSIDKHFHYAVLIEDIVEVQALPTLRQQYTDDMGYSLARQTDYDLHVLGTGLQGGTFDTTPGTPDANTLAYDAAVIGSDGSTLWSSAGAGNGAALADAGIRQMIQTLDDADVPLSQRALVIPPVEKKSLLGLSRFTEQAFTGEMGAANSIRNGLVGDVYGVPVFVSTNCPTITSAGPVNSFRVGLLMHKSAFALAEQMRPRMQAQYQLDWLGNLVVADSIYGTAELRDNAGVAFVVPA